MIEKNSRQFRLVTFITEDNKTKTFAVNEKFYQRNLERLALDTCLVVEYETAVKDETHWVDAEGTINAHTYSGQNISNITRATSQMSKMSTLNILESRLLNRVETNPNAANALAVLYGNMLR